MQCKVGFNPLKYSQSLLQEPRKLSDVVSWQEHIPFAFMLIEMLKPNILVELGTHKGDSYFAFCQTVDMLGISTLCYAVDTWVGDEQAGKYDENIFEGLKIYHDQHYKKFSTLLRCTFDDALTHFTNTSIDLLHIDGLHTYEAVKHDFEKWLPKISKQGVIIFHDIAVHESNFGVWRLWDELKQQYPSFEFTHGNGLGILAVGKLIPHQLRELLFANIHDASNIANFFYFLGSRISSSSITKAQLIEKDKQIQVILKSWSWRLTAPLRALLNSLK